MNTKNYDSATQDGGQHESTRNILSKFDYDLYDEDKDIATKVVRVKLVSPQSKNEKWKVLEDSKIVFIVNSSSVSKKEKEYLRTPAGFNFLIAQYKQGIKSVSKLKISLKKHLK